MTSQEADRVARAIERGRPIPEDLRAATIEAVRASVPRPLGRPRTRPITFTWSEAGYVWYRYQRRREAYGRLKLRRERLREPNRLTMKDPPRIRAIKRLATRLGMSEDKVTKIVTTRIKDDDGRDMRPGIAGSIRRLLTMKREDYE